MQMSGWWLAASAASATAFTSSTAVRKPATLTVRLRTVPSRAQSGRSRRAAASSASVNGSAYGIGLGLPDQTHELGTGPGVAPERSGHGRGDHRRLLLLHATHHGAQMRRLDHACHALGLELLHEELGHLHGEPLLHLEALRVHVDDARDLRQPDHPAARQVADVRLADERQEVVLAEAEELDVAHDHHLVVVDAETRAVDQSVWIDVVPRRQLVVHAPHPLRRADQPFALGILADLRQECPDGLLERGVRICHGPHHTALTKSPLCAASAPRYTRSRPSDAQTRGGWTLS